MDETLGGDSSDDGSTTSGDDQGSDILSSLAGTAEYIAVTNLAKPSPAPVIVATPTAHPTPVTGFSWSTWLIIGAAVIGIILIAKK